MINNWRDYQESLADNEQARRRERFRRPRKPQADAGPKRRWWAPGSAKAPAQVRS
jgi:hypothetical protein